MKQPTRPLRRLAFGLCGLAAAASAGIAGAQGMPPDASGASAPPSSWSAANLPGTEQYQDKYIGGGSMKPDVSSGDAAAGADDSSGLARSVQIDAVGSLLS
jgi:hypothetical protein